MKERERERERETKEKKIDRCKRNKQKVKDNRGESEGGCVSEWVGVS